jgi:hypothetical protein
MERVFRNLSVVTHLPVRFLETAHMSQYCDMRPEGRNRRTRGDVRC